MSTKPKYPIYVISKGRCNSCLTARELLTIKVPFYLVVEPHESAMYKENYPDAVILETPFKNLNKGSIPVRNFVWEHSVSNGYKRHWVLDDNIEGFHRLNRNIKAKVLDGTIFRCCEDFTDRYKNIAISGMNYYSFCKANTKNKPVVFNTRVYSCLLILNSLQLRWRGLYNEDTDLCIRLLKQGWCTVLFNAFLIGKVTTMRMKGGNTSEIYAKTNNRKEFAESLQKQHPDCVKVVWRYNRWHHQVNYKPFKGNLLIRDTNIVVRKGVDNYGMNLISLNQKQMKNLKEIKPKKVVKHLKFLMKEIFKGYKIDYAIVGTYGLKLQGAWVGDVGDVDVLVSVYDPDNFKKVYDKLKIWVDANESEYDIVYSSDENGYAFTYKDIKFDIHLRQLSNFGTHKFRCSKFKVNLGHVWHILEEREKLESPVRALKRMKDLPDNMFNAVIVSGGTNAHVVQRIGSRPTTKEIFEGIDFTILKSALVLQSEEGLSDPSDDIPF